MDIKDFIKQFRQVMTKDNLQSIYVSAIDEDEVIIANQNSLEEGIRPDGQLFDVYSERTIEIKKRDGGFISQSGRIALKDTGSWYDDMYVKRYKDWLEIHNKDIAMSVKLTQDFGDQILEVPKDEIQILIKNAEPNFEHIIEQRLFNK